MCLAIPGKVLSVVEADPMLRARVDFAGAVREVSLVHVPEAKVGDYVIVHVGFALSRLDEAEAMRTLAELRQVMSPTPST
ncbi:MAG: HypC/HybG/HupF family hydrogenase formation chaperone [Deltaproteobacteria bacterium]|nr:HypC/HybG/HupF family hydrogenase formation chaperone [Deltaproteobacteria bacterium]